MHEVAKGIGKGGGVLDIAFDPAIDGAGTIYSVRAIPTSSSFFSALSTHPRQRHYWLWELISRRSWAGRARRALRRARRGGRVLPQQVHDPDATDQPQPAGRDVLRPLDDLHRRPGPPPPPPPPPPPTGNQPASSPPRLELRAAATAELRHLAACHGGLQQRLRQHVRPAFGRPHRQAPSPPHLRQAHGHCQPPALPGADCDVCDRQAPQAMGRPVPAAPPAL